MIEITPETARWASIAIIFARKMGVDEEKLSEASKELMEKIRAAKETQASSRK